MKFSLLEKDTVFAEVARDRAIYVICGGVSVFVQARAGAFRKYSDALLSFSTQSHTLGVFFTN